MEGERDGWIIVFLICKLNHIYSSCQCAPGWTGYNCDTEVNECKLTNVNPCQNGATCVDMLADYSCLCAPFYTGRHCELRYDPCWTEYNPCQNAASCHTSDNGTYTCECPPGLYEEIPI